MHHHYSIECIRVEVSQTKQNQRNNNIFLKKKKRTETETNAIDASNLMSEWKNIVEIQNIMCIRRSNSTIRLLENNFVVLCVRKGKFKPLTRKCLLEC